MSNRVVITIDLPAGVVPDVQYHSSSDEPPHPAASAPSQPQAASGAPSCEHGPRNHKKGTNKAGKPYEGYFCVDDVCAPQWVSSR